MKRTLAAGTAALLCLTAAPYAVARYRIMSENVERHSLQEQFERNQLPLVLDSKTQAILTGADRVETFRLQGGDEDEDVLERSALAKADASPRYLQNHFVISNGPTQGRAFAGALQAALAQGTSEPDPAQCFEPGVGFQAWMGQAHTDICVCFTCQGVEIVAQNAKHTVLHRSLTELGASRPALLALSRQAFPQDARLARLN